MTLTIFRDENTSLPIDALQFLEQRIGLGLYWYDIASQRMEWSDGVYDVLNLVRGQVIPSRAALREMIHPDDLLPLDELDRLFAAGHSFQIEHRIIMRNRRLVRNQGEIIIDADGKSAAVFGVLRDVNDARVANDLIDDYRRRLDTFLKLGTIIAWTAGPDGQFTSVRDWKTAFACDDEPLGMKMLEIIHPDDRAATLQSWCDAVAFNKNFSSECRLLNVSKNFRWHRFSAIPIKTQNGRVLEWFGTAIDINDEKTGGAIQREGMPATGAQIRAARSIARLSVKELSDVSDVSVGTIRRIEDADGWYGEDTEASLKLRAALEERGVKFLYPAGIKPAVCPI